MRVEPWSGLGLRPELTGRGLGEAFVRAELEHARRQWNPAAFQGEHEFLRMERPA